MRATEKGDEERYRVKDRMREIQYMRREVEGRGEKRKTERQGENGTSEGRQRGEESNRVERNIHSEKQT